MNLPSPEELSSQGRTGGPRPTGQLDTPVARIRSRSSSSRAYANGDLSDFNIDRATLQFRDRVPGARVRTTVIDNRRPLYPSMMDES